MEFLDHAQQLRGVELVKVIDEHAAAAQPLAIELAPHGLGPAGFRHGQVQPAVLHLEPVYRREDVPQGVVVVMGHHLGHARGAGGEVEEHDVLILGIGVAGGLFPHVGGGGKALVIAQPARALGAHQHAVFQVGTIRGGFLHGVGHTGGVLRADDGGHVRRLHPVADVLGGEQVGSRDGDGADLVQGDDDGPELMMPLEDEHHGVALFHADGLEVVGRAVGIQHHPPEIVAHHVPLGVRPQKRWTLRVLPAQAVHHVVSKVKGGGTLQAEILIEILIADKVTLNVHIFMI